ncbi:UEV domain-containing protein [Crucibulum laeve]|uniref:UEV domain-containing protein n=1 Tax=Crucibulum laeve TaxID=68775 RepID=A0A5C3MCH8_9AGAR|nr:UEV domain-containing protein [Crucibulum laeve]
MSSTESLTQKWLRQNVQPYPNHNRVYVDIDAALARFSTLRPKSDVYTFDDGRTQLLLCLHGLLPISFRNASYNIPVAVWVTREYPRQPPIAYVVPTADMLVKAGKYVDVSGRCNVEYIQHWQRKDEGCNLSALLEAMQDQFSREPPVYAKPKDTRPHPTPQSTPPPRPFTQQAYADRPPPPVPPFPRDTSSPAISHDRPVLPPKPGSTATSDTLNRATAHGMTSRGSTPVQPFHAGPPPLPPLPPNHSPIPSGPLITKSHPPPIPPNNYAPPRHIPLLSPASPPSGPQMPYLPPKPPYPNSADPPPHPLAASPHPAIYSQPERGSVFVPATGTLATKPTPIPNLLDEDSPEVAAYSVPQSLPSAPPRPPNPELLRLHEQVHHKLTSELGSLTQALVLDAERLRAHQTDLLAGEPAIRDEMARLEAVRDVCNNVANKMRQAVQQAEVNVADLRRKGDPEVDELVCSTSIVHNQLINLVADDNAIEDTIYHLHRALNTGRIDLERFLRTARVLAEEQFMKRALIDKIQAGVPMIASMRSGWE